MLSAAAQKQLESFRTWDLKIIQIRKEIDIEGLHRRVHGKADLEQTNQDFANHEFKIGTLDKNLMTLENLMQGMNDKIGDMRK